MRARYKRRASESRVSRRKAAAKPPKEVRPSLEQLTVLTDYLQENLGVTLAQAQRAVKALKPGAQVLSRNSLASRRGYAQLLGRF